MSHSVRFLNPLGPDTLRFHSLILQEHMSQISEGRLIALSKDRGISLDALLGQRVSIEIETQNWGKRYHNAFVVKAEMGARHESDTMFHFELRSWLWFLARTADCKVFQNQSVVDIVQTVFADCPVSKVSNRLTKTYSPRPYIVQFRESDWNFVSRLLEREGIYYYFEHTENDHTLVLSDGPAAHPKLTGGYAKIPYSDGANALGMSVDKEVFSIWRAGKSIQSGVYVLNDYDFKRPFGDLKYTAQKINSHPHSDAELYDYPGEYRDRFMLGQEYTRVRMQEQACQHERVFASGGVRGCTPGGVFTLEQHPLNDQNRDYLIISTTTRLEESGYESSGGQYHASVEMESQPFSIDYTPPRITPKPFVQGPQTALVVGPAGEEVYCDEYGRVKVQFYWDRYGKKNDQSSCWVRVSHPWAGAGFGGMHLPRIGQEVVVSFMEGDPDFPVITGRMYNAENPPPWALPANKTQSGFLTRSSQGGSAANANAFRFEDKKGAEEVWLHAEKDQRIEVEHDESHWVGNDRVKNIDHDETSHIKHDRTETVDNNETITIHGMRTEVVDKNETITIHQNRTEVVDQNETITIHQNRTETVDQNEQITIHQNRSERVDNSEVVDIGDNRTMSVGKNEKLSVAQNKQDKIGKNWTLKTGKLKTETIGMANIENIGLARMSNIGLAYSLNVGMIMNTVVGMQQSEEIGNKKTTHVGSNYNIDVGDTLSITAGKCFKVTVGASTFVMNADGSIVISGSKIDATASGNVTIIGAKIFLNPSGGGGGGGGDGSSSAPSSSTDSGGSDSGGTGGGDGAPAEYMQGGGDLVDSGNGSSDMMSNLSKGKGAFGTLNQLTKLAAATGLGGKKPGKAAGALGMAGSLLGGGGGGGAADAGGNTGTPPFSESSGGGLSGLPGRGSSSSPMSEDY